MKAPPPPPVKVYGPAWSTAVSRVLACCLEKQVQFELLNVNTSKGDHKSPDFLKLQPFGQVPAFQDESISLFESRAICRYISEKYARQGNIRLYGTDLLEKASIDQWLEAEGQSFHLPTLTLLLLPYSALMNIKVDKGMIKQSKEKLAKVLDVYEKRLGECRYLAGDHFSLADLSHLPNLQYLIEGTGVPELSINVEDFDANEFFASRDNVRRWWSEISSRDSWKKILQMRKSPP